MNLKDTDELIELIDDDIAALKDGYFEDFELPPSAYGSLCALRMVREYTKALPTVEAEPIKHGRWEKDDEMMIFGGNIFGDIPVKCSQCGFKTLQDASHRMDYHYCPKCGAIMDEVEE